MQVDNPKEYFREKFGLTEENVKEYAEIASSYAVYRGLLKRTEDFNYVPLPFCLTPSQFPARCFKLVKEVQRTMNYIIHKVAGDESFLASCFERSNYLDDFNSKLWEIQKTVLQEGIKQNFNLRILRCDYMLHRDGITGNIEIKLVENNTMAVAMASLSSMTRDLYEYTFDRLGKKELMSKVPTNTSAFGLALGLETMWKYYSRYDGEDAVIVFVVEGPDMTNICDHRALEFDTWKREKEIRIIRRTFEELRATATLTEDRKLFVGEMEVAVVYYRWGYKPEHYTEGDWELRLMIERSTAVKIPTVAYQLAGSKKVQQQLTVPGALAPFVPPKTVVTDIWKLFVPQQVLELNDKNSKSVVSALKNPAKYVVKADREGGGNNIFGEDIVKFINSYEKTDSNQLYILMEKINSPKCPNYVVKHNCPPRLTDVVAEIGVYGFAIATAANSWESSNIGYVVKSKEYGMNEGGLCSGLSFIDSPFLC